MGTGILYIIMTVYDLKKGEFGFIIKPQLLNSTAKRLLELGLTPKTKIYMIHKAPFLGPCEIFIRGYFLTLKRISAKNFLIKKG